MSMNRAVATFFCLLCFGTTGKLANAQVGLVSHFTFDGTTENEVDDVPAGVLMNGASLTDGALGQALLLDGVDDWFDTTVEGQPSGETLFETTIAFWFQLAEGANTASIQFLGNLNAGADSTAVLAGTNGASGLQIFPRATDGPSYIVRTASDEGDVFAPDLSWTDGEWHHLAFAWSIGFQNEAAIYVNGQLQPLNVRQSDLSDNDDFLPWENGTSIGARNNRGMLDSFVSGKIDDFRVYDVILEPEDIADLAAVEVNVFTCDPNTLGDADGNGEVAFLDFLILADNFGQKTNDHRLGDFDCNGEVTFLDFLILALNFGTSVEAQPVPEPSGLTICGVFGLSVLMLRKRTRTSCKTLFPMGLVLLYEAFSNGSGGFETASKRTC